MASEPTAADLAAFGASDAACYLYPGEDQAAERAAFCAGAAYSAGGFPLTPDEIDAAREAMDRADEKQRHEALDGVDSITNLVKNEKETK